MKKYKAIENVRLSIGVVILDEGQAKSRIHNLNPSDNKTRMIEKTANENEYQINGYINFKAGEVFQWSGDTSRMSGLVREISTKLEVIEPVKTIEPDVKSKPDEHKKTVKKKAVAKKKTEVPAFTDNES